MAAATGSCSSSAVKGGESNIVKSFALLEYYHGLLLPEDITGLLRKDGDFLLRSSEPVKGAERSFYLSVLANTIVKDFPIVKADGGRWQIETFSFDSIKQMIDYHINEKLSITKDGQTVIRTAIKRQHWEHCHENITLGKKLGGGTFGEVSQGRLRIRVPAKSVRGVKPKSNRLKKTSSGAGFIETKLIDVALKVAKIEDVTKEVMFEIMQEARLMRKLQHPNVVRYHGQATMVEPVMVIMELCADGGLDHYLHKVPVPVEQLHDMVLQAALGLEYIHKKNVIHRDIAARNCLYGNDIVKIADFGLSKEGVSFRSAGPDRVPTRWLAPECILTGFFSQKTDVWAFGVLAWEIYHYGEEPYAKMSLVDVKKAVTVDGYRLKFHERVPAKVADYISNNLWSSDANKRPIMSAVVQHLGQLFGITRLA